MMKSSSDIRVAVIGAGYMAREHMKAFAACKNVKIVGIHSRTHSKAQQIAKSYPGVKILDSVGELYHRTNADLVVIAVPILACRIVCQEAFKYNWKMLIEKPVGYNLEEANKLEELAESLKADVYVGFNRRFYTSTIQLQQALRSIEQKRVVTINDQEDIVAAIATGQPKKVIDNWMFANSIHLIDYFNQLCRGKHLQTEIITPWEPKNPGSVVAKLSFSSGDIGIYQAIWNAPGPWSVAVSTPILYAELRPLEQLRLQFKSSREIQIQPNDPVDKLYKPGLLRQAEESIAGARNKETTLPNLSEANSSMRLVASIYGIK